MAVFVFDSQLVEIPIDLELPIQYRKRRRGMRLSLLEIELDALVRYLCRWVWFVHGDVLYFFRRALLQEVSCGRSFSLP